MGAPGRRDDRDRVGHGDQHPIRRARDARDRDPRGRPRCGRARLPARSRVEPPLDPYARPIARPPPVVPARGAFQRVAERGDGQPHPHPRGDGRRARLLRPEHKRRGRRSAERHPGRRVDGRHVGHGPAAGRAERGQVRRRERRADARADHEALREDRADADEPHARQCRLPRRPDRRRAPGSLQARVGRADPRPGVRHRRELHRGEQGRRRADRPRGDRQEGALRRRARDAPQPAESQEARARLDEGRDMATDVTGDVTTGVQASPTEQQAPEPKPSRRRRPYQLRFLVVYGILAGVLGAGIAGIVLLVGTSVGGGAASWSTWKPTKSGAARVSQIAQHVSKAYRLTDGGQLLDVIAKPPAVQNVPIKAVAVRNKAGNADEVSLFDDQNSLMLVLCGGGTACAISKGTASVERGRLVRREALELALYTFKYVGNVKYIVAFMPPKKGSQP